VHGGVVRFVAGESDLRELRLAGTVRPIIDYVESGDARDRDHAGHTGRRVRDFEDCEHPGSNGIAIVKVSLRIFGITLTFGMWSIHKLLLLGIAVTLIAHWLLGELK
jgi:hypothetical protein